MISDIKIVCIGGGTGLPQLLMGLKLLSREAEWSSRLSLQNITAIVTTFDDGGSSGRIIEAYRTLPPGDLRNCMVALADERVEPLLTRFFDHRFGEDEHETLAGHSVGNLLLLSLSQIYGGDLRKALLSVRQVLPIRSTILFSTLIRATLCARLTDGNIVRGESRIATREERAPIREIFLEPSNDSDPMPPEPMDGVLDAIASADLVTLGPGSLYTSILPHFLVDGVREAIHASRARVVYICNLMTEPGETDGFRLSDHLKAVIDAGVRIDRVVANDAPVPEALRRAYERERLQLQFRRIQKGLERSFEKTLEQAEAAVEFRSQAESACLGLKKLAEGMGRGGPSCVQVLPEQELELPGPTKLLTADLLAELELTEAGNTKKVIRHDPLKLARTILSSLPE